MGNEDQDRRVLDRDHDLLVQLARDVGHLCRKHDVNHDEVRQDLKAVHDRIDRQSESCKLTHATCSHFFVPRYVFYWAVILAFMTVTFVGGIAITNQTAIKEHKAFATEAGRRIDEKFLNLNDKVWSIPNNLMEETE